MQTGCFLKLKLSDLSIQCKNLEGMSNILQQQNATHVAIFGTSPVEFVADWLTIYKQNKPPQSQFEAPDQCTQVVTGMQIQVSYSKAVSISSNPQPKIIEIFLVYGKLKIILLQCDPTNYEKDTVLNCRLPFDFFYPFYLIGSVKNYE
uniref:Tectonic-1-3 domain-containing protein n=1 Tax=Octopus bimaculoides TaxID=37653 RepID=A0A0L8HYJ0_OCTBM